jgi:hypothetical protein
MRRALKRLGSFSIPLLALAAFCAPPASADFSEFGIESASARLSTYQAGAHPDLTTSFRVRTNLSDELVAQTRDVFVDLPPGLIGDPTSVPQCAMADLFDSSGCPQDSQVGVTEIVLRKSGTLIEPIYNMDSPGGDVVARLGFIAELFPTMIEVRLRSEGDYGVTAAIERVSSLIALEAARTTIWGVPASPAHDLERITPEEANGTVKPPAGGRPSGVTSAPFLSNPTRCGPALAVSISAASYQVPDSLSTVKVPLGPITGCGKVSFEPNFRAIPTTSEAAAPSGLDVELQVRQDRTVQGLASSHLEDARVTLPEGMTLAAGAASGLDSCSPGQAGYRSRGPAACPAASKLGTAEFDVPGLERPLQGAVYQRTPEPGQLFRVWIVADDLGAHVALPGQIDLDPRTGRITSSFLDNPEVPLRELRLHLFGGPRAPLATPATCGTYQTQWQLTPWSGNGAVSGEAPMTIDRNCQAGGFAPELSAGTKSARAGAFAPLSLELTRDSGEENIAGLELSLPPGLLAKLAGVAVCDGAAAAAGACPADSRVGSVTVASGPGSNPLWIPQPGREPTAVFLGGPYKGAPLSLVIRVPAEAGPFDLGTVVVRGALQVDPATARVTIDSGPLPQFLEGVPISYRTIHAETDRPGFTLNPTNCKPMALSARVSSALGAVATPSARFQVGSCPELGFKPKLRMRLTGGTRRAAHPALRATLTAREGDANISSATVILPSSQFIDNARIGSPCTRPQFAAGKCPPASRLGTARAFTPLLERPLEGAVYLRANGGERKLPDVVADLKGQIDIVLVGHLDSVGAKGSEVARIRTVFPAVPDAPVRKFALRIFGGKRGLLVNSVSLCTAPRRAKVRLVGQNGRQINFNQVVKSSCANSKRRQSQRVGPAP